MPDTPPADHVVEVSLFGPGIGECVVLHLGNGDWAIVDSCVAKSTGSPVALDYLTKLGVDVAKQVKLVIVTHWHDDHMKGASGVVRACEAAQFACSAALNNVEFKTLLATSGTSFLSESGIDEFRDIVEIMKQRKAAYRRASAGPDKWALEGRLLHQSAASRIWSLSPSDATFTLALEEFGRLLPRPGQPKRRLVAQRPNAICTVLWVQVLGHSLLLGSDLEVTRNPTTGWTAVLNSDARPAARASVYKVAHHGSENADEPRVWSELLEPDTHALVTPFRKGKRPLPADEDRARIQARTTNAHATAPVHTSRTKLTDSAARKVARLVAPDLRPLESSMGQVRVRWPEAGSAQVELFGEARPLADAG